MDNNSAFPLTKNIYSYPLLKGDVKEGFPGKWDLVIAFYTIFVIANFSFDAFFISTYAFVGSFMVISILYRTFQLKQSFLKRYQAIIILLVCLSGMFILTYSYVFSYYNLMVSKGIVISEDIVAEIYFLAYLALALAQGLLLTLHNWFWFSYNECDSLQGLWNFRKKDEFFSEFFKLIIPYIMFTFNCVVLYYSLIDSIALGK